MPAGETTYRARRRRLLVGSAALLLAGAVFWLGSALPIDHLYGSLALALGAGGLLFHLVRPPLQLVVEAEGLSVRGALVPWREVHVSELKERMRRSLRFPLFELIVKDESSKTGRRTYEIAEPEWPRFDELYESLRGFSRAASQSTASR